MAGQAIQRIRARAFAATVLDYRQQFPILDEDHPIRLTAPSPVVSAWPLFCWSVASTLTHSIGRRRELVDALSPQLEWQLPRGTYQTEFRLQLADSLGLTLWRSSFLSTAKVTVYCRSVMRSSPKPPSLRSAPAGPRTAPRREGEALDVRVYHVGDDVRRLHWALWAHTGQAWLRIPDLAPPPNGRKVWIVDLSMPASLSPEEAELALDRRLEPLSPWILDGSSWLLVFPALGISVREASLLPSALAGAKVALLKGTPDLSWSRGLSDTLVVVTGPGSPDGQQLKNALEPRIRVSLTEIPLPVTAPASSRHWWERR